MKLLSLNRKNNTARIFVNSLDDLWHLSKIIDEGDFVSGDTERKIKLGGDTEKPRVIRKVVKVKIQVTKLVFAESELRVQGIVVQGPDEIPANSAHSVEILPGKEFWLEKPKWMEYQLNRLKEAEKSTNIPKMLVCVLDDEQASFGYLTSSGMKPAGSISLRLTKKRMKEEKKDDLEKVAVNIIMKVQQNKIKQIIVGSPLLWKDEVVKILKQKDANLAKNVILADVSTGSAKGLTELIKGDSLNKILKESQLNKASKLLETILLNISKDTDLAVYGLNEIISATNASAVQELLVSEKLMNRRSEHWSQIESVIEKTERSGGTVHLIDKGSEVGHQLDGLGGIAALLKFKLRG